MQNNILETSVRYLKGVGESREKLFNKLGIYTLRDLVGYFPRDYEDRRDIQKIYGLKIGEKACISATVADEPRLSRTFSGRNVVKFRAFDETGSIELIYFNAQYVKNAIKCGSTYIFYGKADGTRTKPVMFNPTFEDAKKSGATTGCILPIYRLTAKLSSASIAGAVRHTLEKCGDILPDVIPDNISKEYKLCKARFAYENIHFPSDFKARDIARTRLIFEELFILVVAMRFLRERRITKSGKAFTDTNCDELTRSIPFAPTKAQNKSIDDIARDLSQSRPMNRLIQGDVGSGKTLVAAAACFMAYKSGYQSAFMAPTEILVNQHYATLSAILSPLGVEVGLLTGGKSAKEKREIYEKLKNGNIDLIIGTHALISGGVEFSNLALAITDEQHRFGVNQRSMLSEKGDSPHVLVMSATPIPRTLSLIIYGDLDVSVIDEMPPGRTKIETHIVDERHRKRVYAFVEKLVAEGRQVYIICPMVDENDESFPGITSAEIRSTIDTSGAAEASNRTFFDTQAGSNYQNIASAEKMYKELHTKVLKNLKVAMVHGKMATKEKDKVMKSFASGDIDVLVATTVVEVGVDVPNATLMIIENADRFGLSQLHQLRGRVGRGKHESHCILFRTAVPQGEVSSKAMTDLTSVHQANTSQIPEYDRLQIMKSTNDGFVIAEEDLKLRGPGDFFGSRQHGLPVMKIANLATDMLVLSQAVTAAETVLKSDPSLSDTKNKELKERVTATFSLNSEKMN